RAGPPHARRQRRQRTAVRGIPAEDCVPGRRRPPRRRGGRMGQAGGGRTVIGVPRGVTGAALTAALASAAGAGRAQAGTDGGGDTLQMLIDRREIIVPAKAAEVVRIDNLLGRVSVRGVARPGEIHIIAEKRASTQDALGRLRVHYTAFENGEV